MQPPPIQQSRVNLVELKAQLVKKLGPDGSKQYFHYLNRFLSLKLSKAEFNKLCFRILGRDNIQLHNQLIRSILKNACSGKAPPPLVSSKDISTDGYLQNGSHTGTALANGGDMLPVSPRKARTGARERKPGDRRSALRLDAPQPGFAPPPTRLSDFNAMENRDLGQGLTQQAENENGIPGPAPADMSVLRNSQDGSGLLYSKEGLSARSPVRAPLGVPLCPVSTGGAHRGASSGCVGTSNDSLLDSLTLREQMEHIATSHGLEGVSVECANIVNSGLDSYLKGLIRSCIQLAGAKSRNELTQKNTQNTHKQLAYVKPINGIKPGFQYQMQNIVKPFEGQGRKISLQDFRVAMEMNPSQLGEDWPLLLEKICTNAFEE